MFTIFQYMKLCCVPIYINKKLSESWIKKTSTFTIASQKDKTLRNKLKQGVERFYKKPLRHWSGEGNSNPLQYSSLENPMDRGACRGYCPWGREESGMTEWLPFPKTFIREI